MIKRVLNMFMNVKDTEMKVCLKAEAGTCAEICFDCIFVNTTFRLFLSMFNNFL